MRAIGYVRISKADKDKTGEQQRLSLRQQEEVIRAACSAKGWELVAIKEDFALSGNDDTRPGFAEVAAAIDAKEADVVVVRHVDRLYRNAWRLLRLVESRTDGGDGWRIHSVEQSFDTDEPEGWFAFAQFALFGDFERRMTKKRTKNALARLRKEGVHTGRRSLIPPEVEDRIYRLYTDEGMSGEAIARLLTKEGVRRPTPGKGVKGVTADNPQVSRTWTGEHVLAAVRRVETRRRKEAAA